MGGGMGVDVGNADTVVAAGTGVAAVVGADGAGVSVGIAVGGTDAARGRRRQGSPWLGTEVWAVADGAVGVAARG